MVWSPPRHTSALHFCRHSSAVASICGAHAGGARGGVKPRKHASAQLSSRARARPPAAQQRHAPA